MLEENYNFFMEYSHKICWETNKAIILIIGSRWASRYVADKCVKQVNGEQKELWGTDEEVAPGSARRGGGERRDSAGAFRLPTASSIQSRIKGKKKYKNKKQWQEADE